MSFLVCFLSGLLVFLGLGDVEVFAATGVDLIVLSSAYFGKPADIKVSLMPVL